MLDLRSGITVWIFLMFLMSLLAFLSILHHIVKTKLISINLTLDTFFGEGNGTPLQYPCLEHPMDRGAWWAAVHGVAKSWTWLSDFTFTFYFHALEKEMATHSSVLAWRIPGTGEPGGLPSMGSHIAGHNWSDLAAADTFFPDFLRLLLLYNIAIIAKLPKQNIAISNTLRFRFCDLNSIFH